MGTEWEKLIKLLQESMECKGGSNCIVMDDAERALCDGIEAFFQDNGQTILGDVKIAVNKSIFEKTYKECPLKLNPDSFCETRKYCNLCISVPLTGAGNEDLRLSLGAMVRLREDKQAVCYISCFYLYRVTN